jgi:capsule biosynthesis phosphatase
MDYTKTLVVDFDDTLAYTLNRDWQNAEPNTALIEKLNGLFDQGWTINILTARGNISCKTRQEADEKYRPQIEKWLEDNHVKYSSLSFEKPLAVYYIDDKGITPEDFLDNFQRVALKGGMSGADVYLDKATNDVYKTAKNTHQAVEWYKKAEKEGLNVPKVKSVIGDTIRMEKLYDYHGDWTDVIQQVISFKDKEPIYNVDPMSYVGRTLNRICDRQDCGDLAKLRDRLIAIMAIMKTSFSHGDLSCDNIMSDKWGEIHFIDPINDPTLFSSWELDLAKLYMSAGIRKLNDLRSIIEKIYDSSEKLRILELSHLCRVLPYCPKGKDDVFAKIIKEKIDVLR